MQVVFQILNYFMLRSITKRVFFNRQGQAMLEYLMILAALLIVFYGFTFSFKEILAPAFKRMTAVVRWPVP